MKNLLRRLKLLYQNRYITMYIYRKFNYIVYPKLFHKPRIELMCVNQDGSKYQIIFKQQPKLIKAGDQEIVLKKFSDHRGFIWVSNDQESLEIDNFQYQLESPLKAKVSADSIIIVADRHEKAGDNGEYFYDWILANKPEYQNVYFAISKTSNDYQRLAEKGFKLLDTASKSFRDLYKNADVIISSVYSEQIENHRQLRYKRSQTPNSKFICLSHGVSYLPNEQSAINANQKINYKVISQSFEVDNLVNTNIWYKQQLPQIGMSRTKVAESLKQTQTILYMPTWNLSAFRTNNITSSELFKSIEAAVTDSKLVTFLDKHNYTLKLVIHPQLSTDFAVWSKLAAPSIAIVNGNDFNYQSQISECLMVITDYSSVFFDALSYRKNVIFHQPSNLNVINSDLFTKAGVVTTSVSDLVKQLEDNHNRRFEFSSNLSLNLHHQDAVNEQIWELVTNG